MDTLNSAPSTTALISPNGFFGGMHASKSETVGQLLPEGVERQLRAQLRSLRFDQPQDYARLQQIEVNKFLSSKSVHNWLSEWELSRAFGGGGGNGTLDSQLRGHQMFSQSNCWTASNCSKADAAVQCMPEEIDAELGGNNNMGASAYSSASYARQQDAQFQFNGGGTSGSPHPRYSWQRNILQGNDQFQQQQQQRRWRGPRISGSFSNNQPWLPYGGVMDASTNTQTTEETGGTSGMNIYRRASYLEEYAMERVREMEEEKLAKEAKEREREAARKRRKRANFWRRCFCRKRRGSSEDRTSSTSFGNSNSTKKLSSNTQGTSSFDRNSNSGLLARQRREMIWANEQPILVKKFTLSRSGGGGGGMEALRFNATIPGCNYGAVTGNYENVTPPPPEEIWRNGRANEWANEGAHVNYHF